ncbi:MAG: phosphoribosylglycinamide formyltransferase [Brevundimonas sp.]
MPPPPPLRMRPEPVPVAVLISGGGSNLAAILAAARARGCPYRVAVVVSNRPEAGGLAHAAAAGVPVEVVDHRPFAGDRACHEREIEARLRAHGVELVVLAGYMRVLTPWLVERWAGRMLNIHPSLLPKYPGLDTHARAIAAGDAEAGCTVHVVTAGVDEGPVLDQARVPILPEDTAETLAARVLAAEHRLYPAALARVAADLRT